MDVADPVRGEAGVVGLLPDAQRGDVGLVGGEAGGDLLAARDRTVPGDDDSA